MTWRKRGGNSRALPVVEVFRIANNSPGAPTFSFQNGRACPAKSGLWQRTGAPETRSGLPVGASHHPVMLVTEQATALA